MSKFEINPLEIFDLNQIKKRIENTTNPKDLLTIIETIETRLNFIKSTIYDNHFFLVAPGTHEKSSKWIKSLIDYGSLDIKKIEKLISHGFVVFSRALLKTKSVFDIFESLGFTNDLLLLDKDYGLVLLPEPSKKKNFYFGMNELTRYGETYPLLQEQLSNLLSIGAMRVHALINSKFDFSPIEIELSSREELLSYVNLLNEKLQKSNSRFQIWFRGQSSEYFMDKLDTSLFEFCPWRSILDVSLVPSLFRKSELIQNDLKGYATKLYEILNYEIGLSNHLNIPKYEIRKSEVDEIKKFFLKSVWEDSNAPLSIKVVNSEFGTSEIHDYNPIYRGLQTSLFLQHYGIQTNILDITQDIDSAIFFAQHTLTCGKYIKQEEIDKSVIYLFLLDPKTDRFLDSTILLENFGIQRPLRQKCGVLAGASYSNQNYYSKFVSIRFKLSKHIEMKSGVTKDYLFPPIENDDILKFLTKYSEEKELTTVKPF